MNPPEAPQPIAWQEPLLDVIDAIIAQKWVIISILFIGTSLGALRLSRMPSIYTASAVAVLLPREKAMIDASVDTSSVDTSDDSVSRGSGSLMLPANPSLYVTIIHSPAVLTEIANKFNDRFDGEISSRDRSVEVIERLQKMISTSSTEEGLITITVHSETPELSADIANELFAACEKASKSIERQLLVRQAGHLDKALKISSDRLDQTERRLSNFTSKIGLVDADTQARNQLYTVRELNALKDKVEAELVSLRISHTDNSPPVQELLARIATMEGQIIASHQSIIGEIGTDNFGELSVAYKSLTQKIRFERDMVSALATKSDIYRLRAEQPIGNIAIIRNATVPTRPSGPSKKMEVGVSIGLSLVLAIGYALGMQQLLLLKKNPHLSSRTESILQKIHPRLKLRQD